MCCKAEVSVYRNHRGKVAVTLTTNPRRGKFSDRTPGSNARHEPITHKLSTAFTKGARASDIVDGDPVREEGHRRIFKLIVSCGSDPHTNLPHVT